MSDEEDADLKAFAEYVAGVHTLFRDIHSLAAGQRQGRRLGGSYDVPRRRPGLHL